MFVFYSKCFEEVVFERFELVFDIGYFFLDPLFFVHEEDQGGPLQVVQVVVEQVNDVHVLHQTLLTLNVTLNGTQLLILILDGRLHRVDALC
jgi:hypothetical protein